MSTPQFSILPPELRIFNRNPRDLALFSSTEIYPCQIFQNESKQAFIPWLFSDENNPNQHNHVFTKISCDRDCFCSIRGTSIGKCVCKRGYVKHGGRCILMQDCPIEYLG